MDTTDILLRFLLAAALGALIGLERQVGRDEREKPYAGLRTFSLYGLWGASAGFLGGEFGAVAFATAAAGFAALVVTEYILGSRDGDTGTTTEAAAFAAFVIGVLAWEGREVAALALAVGVAALLQSKVWIHSKLSKFTDEDVRAALRFGVLTAVILPLVPNEDMGPFSAINPFEIWLMVVFVAGIGLAGYVALRLLGPKGLAPTGLLGGIVSSTAVTLGFARISKRRDQVATALAAGVVAASGLMYVRVLIESAVVAPSVARDLVVPLVALFLGVEGAAAWLWWRSRHEAGDPDFDVKNPVTVSAAVQFGLLYGIVAFIAAMLVDRFSESSLSLVALLSGINDVDAITLASSNLARDGTVASAAAADAVLIAVGVNTLAKAVLALALGSRRFGRLVARILLPAAGAAGIAWAVL